MLVGAGEVVGDQPADLERLAVVGLVVPGRQGVRAEHDATLDLVAETRFARRHVHRVGVGRVDPESVAHAVVASEIARRLGRRDQVVGGEAVRERRDLDVDDLRPGVGERVEGDLDLLEHVRVGPFGQIGDAPHAQSLHAVVERRGDDRGGQRDRRRVVEVVASDHLDRQRGVGDGVGERPDLVEAAGERDEPVAADDPIRGLHADDAAQRRRLADRTARVAAEPERGKPGRDRGGAPATRPTRHAGRVVRVAGRSERRVLGARPHRELVEVGLADQHRAGRPQPLHHGAVVRRTPTVEDLRRARRDDAPRAHVVLQRYRHAGEWSGIASGGHGGVDVVRGGAGLVPKHGVEGVQLALPSVDCGEVLIDDLTCRALAGPHRGGDGGRGRWH